VLKFFDWYASNYVLKKANLHHFGFAADWKRKSYCLSHIPTGICFSHYFYQTNLNLLFIGLSLLSLCYLKNCNLTGFLTLQKKDVLLSLDIRLLICLLLVANFTVNFGACMFFFYFEDVPIGI